MTTPLFRAFPERAPDGERALTRGAILILVIVLLSGLTFLVLAGNQPVLFRHGFRQSQTAISVYWMLRDGLSLSYATPVLGAPWAIPFEFPVYQSLVAAVASLGVPLDLSGRLVSFAAAVLCLWPIFSLVRDFGGRTWHAATCGALFLAAPVYAFWATSFMIETTALFLGLLFLAAFVRFLSTGRWLWAATAGLAGVLCGLAKATTLPGFSLAAGLVLCACLLVSFKGSQSALPKARLAASLVPLLLPYPIAMSWVAYTDKVKALNPLGASLTSDALKEWNYGTLAQKLSGEFWLRLVPDAIGWQTFGPLFPLALVVLLGALIAASRRRRAALWVGLGLLTCFLVPMLVFTNLYIQHDYYRVANTVFLTLAVGLGLAFLAKRVGAPLGLVGLGILCSGQVFFTVILNMPLWSGQFRHPILPVAEAVQEVVPEDAPILVFGHDWNSAIPYYAERKALMISSLVSDLVDEIVDDPTQFLDGAAPGGVVICTLGDKPPATKLSPLLADRAQVFTDDSCSLYR
ncbi:hypothetical protein [Litorisediminicola beolgyonensis]|uniref:Glycosyltransferase RgtA/B/C/D-like domain-containing protein n=1 Tax=Litorisediminicola beolgyonensis TaxID=1173614 RepID=A0ABW3ZKX0_9RHOB